MDLIEELYYGNIQPNLKKEIQNENYNKAMEFVTANEDIPTSRLSLSA